MSTALWVGPLAGMTLRVEVAWGADLTDTDGSGWTWVDVTADVRQAPGISTKLGRGDEASRSQPASLTLTLDNTDGGYSLGGQSANYPYVRRGTPVRVRVDPADGAGSRVVFLGYADGWSPSWDAAGAVPTVELSASGVLRRLQQGSAPLVSAYRRSMTDTATVVAYWPLEAAAGATSSPAVRGGTPASPSLSEGITWASSSVFESSGPLPQVDNSNITAVVNPYTQTTENQVRYFVVIPAGGLTDGSVLSYISTTGTLGRWDIVYSDAGTGNLSLYIYNSDGTLNSSTVNVTFDMDGNRRRLSLQLTQSGSDVNWRMEVLDANPGDPGGGISGTVLSKTVGIVSQVQLAPLGRCSGTVFGHITVQNDVASNFEAAEAYWAWQRRTGSSTGYELPSAGTPSASRIDRLCTENGVFADRYTSPGSIPADDFATFEGMGPQGSASLLDLLFECETVDQGQLWDGRTAGLTFTTRRYREVGTVALTLDAAAGELAPPFSAIDDDQRTRNQVTVRRTAGAEATYADTTGPMGVDVVGLYDTSVDANAANDTYPPLLAGWLVALGTVTGYRTPTLTVDLRTTPYLAGDVLDLIPGDRVQVLAPAAALGAFPTAALDLIVEGIAHAIDASGWVVTLTCSPFLPWSVGRVGDESADVSEFLLRPDSDGSTLAAAAGHSVTSISVATPSGPLWTTAADDYPLDLDVGGIRVHATACSGTTSPQTFTVDALDLDRASGAAVALWHPHPLGL